MAGVKEGTIITVDGERYVSERNTADCNSCVFVNETSGFCNNIPCDGACYKKIENWKEFLISELKKLEGE